MLRTRTGGYSLIEMIIYVALLAVLSIAAVGGLVTLMRSYSQLIVQRRVDAAAQGVIERFSREAHAAYAIDLATSTLGLHPGHLVLKQRDGDGAEHTADFYYDTGQVRMRVDGVSQGVLTRSGVSIQNIVWYATSTPVSTLVTLRLTVQASSGRASTTQTFWSSALLQGNYGS